LNYARESSLYATSRRQDKHQYWNGRETAKGAVILVPAPPGLTDAGRIRHLPDLRFIGAKSRGNASVGVDIWNLDSLPARIYFLFGVLRLAKT
jgi:hypothetical protein